MTTFSKHPAYENKQGAMHQICIDLFA